MESKKMKNKNVLLQIGTLVLILASFTGITGDFGSGGGVSTIRHLTSENIKVKKHKLEYYFFVEELSKLSGSVSTEQLNERLNENIREKARKRASRELPPENFQSQTFWIERHEIPQISFMEIYISDIIAIGSRNRGMIDIDDVFSFHIRTDINEDDGHKVKSIIGLELIDGSLVLLEDIEGLELNPAYEIN
jgi:hypothetical protein